MSGGDRVFGIVNGILLAIVTLVVLYPLYFSLIASFSSPQAVYQGRVLLLPADITLRGYEKIFADPSIWTSYFNSIVYTLVGTACNLIFTIPLAFALSRKEFPLGGVYMKLMVFTMYFYGGIIPLYFVVKDLGLLDSMWSLILPTVIATYNLIIARSFFISSIPEDLKEAAFLDGCGYLRFFFSIVLPLSKTNLAALFVITFIYGWNQYLWPLLIIQDVNLGTAVAGIKGMIATGEGTTQWNQVMAAMLLTLIPPVVIVLAMQRAFVRGLVDSEK